jgi:hypothetical protein
VANKFGARRTKVDGIWFDSAAEARRYQELRLMEKAGVISELELQVPYPLAVAGHHICLYKADFHYFDREKQAWVVEDVKGVRTAEYKIKRKLMKAVLGIDIVEIPARP